MSSYIEELNRVAKEDTLKKMKVLRTHSFKVICNSLIKLLDEVTYLFIYFSFYFYYLFYFILFIYFFF